MGKPTNAYTDKAPIFAISRHRLLTDGKGVTTLVTFMTARYNVVIVSISFATKKIIENTIAHQNYVA